MAQTRENNNIIMLLAASLMDQASQSWSGAGRGPATPHAGRDRSRSRSRSRERIRAEVAGGCSGGGSGSGDGGEQS